MTKTVRYEIGESEWVELWDPADQTHRKVSAAIRQFTGFKNGVTSDEEMDGWLRDRIAAWHLIDPDTEKVMEDPKTDDLEGLKKGTLKTIIEGFFALANETVPFGSGSRSSST